MTSQACRSASRGLSVATAASASALILLLIGCASSNLGRSLNVAVVGAGIADVASLDSRVSREGNPVMGQSLQQQVIVKSLGIAAVLGGAFLVEERGHPVWAQIIRGVMIGAWTMATIHNARLH